MRHATIALGMTLQLTAAVAVAQSAPAAPADSSAACQPDFSVRDTLTVIISASLPVDHTEPVEVQMLRRPIYEAYLRQYHNPASVYYTDIWRKPTSLTPGGWLRSKHKFGEVRFTIAADGRVTDFRIVPGTPDERFDSALADAATRLDSARFTFKTADHRDTLQMRILLDSAGDRGIMPVPLIEGHLITVPRSDAVVVRGDPPKYPARLQGEHQPGDVIVAFKVRRDGRPDMSSVRVTSATRKEFVDAVLEVLPTYQFRPAMVSGCAEEDWAELPFAFRAP